MDADRAALSRPTGNVPPHALRIALAAVPLAFLALFYVWPLATLLARFLRAEAIVDALGRPGLARTAWFTLWQAVLSTVLTLAIGLGPAFLLGRWEFRGRRVLRALVTVPFLLPTVVVGAAFVSLLPDGLIGTPTAVIAAHVFFNIAVVVRVVGALWQRLPPDVEAAARTLGASPAQVLREVTLPLLRPALLSSAIVVFLFTFTSFGAVQILGGPEHPTIEVEVARRALQLGDVSGAAVLAVLQLVVLGAVIAAAAGLQRRARVPLAGDVAPRRRVDTRRQRLALGAGALLTAVVVAAPLVALALSSFRIHGRWAVVAWTDLGRTEIRPGLGLGVDAAGSILRSLRAAALATAAAVVVGALAACAIAVARRRGRLLDAGLMLPLATSGVTIGLGMLITFDRAPVDWRGEPWLVALGHALVAAPFVVRTILPVLMARPVGWLDAAATLGASPARAWWEIDVPRLRRPLVVAAAFAAAISLGEFGATTLLSRSGRETVPVAIARLLGRAGDIPRAQAFVLATMLAAVTVALILVVDSFDREAGEERGLVR